MDKERYKNLPIMERHLDRATNNNKVRKKISCIKIHYHFSLYIVREKRAQPA